MSIASIAVTMGRIRVAQPDSPISVFIIEDKVDGKTIRRLDSLFSNTVEAMQRKLEEKPERTTDYGQTNFTWEWIGDYHWINPAKAVRALLKRALEK